MESFTHEDIQKSGRQTTEQFLLSLPIVNSNVIPVSNNENGSNTAVGAAAVSLRGLDPRATLVLIDGRRVAPYPIGNNPGPVNTMFVDLNSIPEAAIESIEILKDGASAVYGADAVAGVVNLKMRHYYTGAEASIARLVQGTTITFGVNNVFDDDPPFASGEGGNGVGYPGFTYDATNRFWYWRITKKF